MGTGWGRMALIYGLAALAEIGGCYAVYAVLRLGRPALWLVPGIVLLALFAWLLTLVETGAAGRTYAIYGAVYILAALGWMVLVERVRPDAWDIAGVLLCLIGAAIIAGVFR